jgi:hypothetical protein
MKPKPYIVWSKKDINLNSPYQKRWYIKQVLLHGRAEDVAELNWNEVKVLLDRLDLPKNIYRLWRNYFATTQS